MPHKHPMRGHQPTFRQFERSFVVSEKYGPNDSALPNMLHLPDASSDVTHGIDNASKSSQQDAAIMCQADHERCLFRAPMQDGDNSRPDKSHKIHIYDCPPLDLRQVPRTSRLISSRINLPDSWSAMTQI